MTLAMLIQGKRNTDDTRLANANLAKVATIPVNPADVVPKLAGLAILALAEAENHGTKASIGRESVIFQEAEEIVKSGANPKAIWRNPYPQGTPEARAEKLRIIEAARRGEAI